MSAASTPGVASTPGAASMCAASAPLVLASALESDDASASAPVPELSLEQPAAVTAAPIPTTTMTWKSFCEALGFSIRKEYHLNHVEQETEVDGGEGGRLLSCPMSRVYAAWVMALAVAVASGCTQRARMCNAPNECGASQGCVAGRCLPDGGVPAIQSARRLVYAPVDLAFIRRGDAPTGGAPPPIAPLGRASDGAAILLLRFDVPLAKDANVLEAYLDLERTSAVDVDLAPISLHAARIVGPWDGRSISWALQPRIEESRGASTTVAPAAGRLVRVDVRDLVLRWRIHEPADHGIAVVADATSATGMAFALSPVEENDDSIELSAKSAPVFGGTREPSRAAERTREVSGPRLELYVK